jgi:protein phosphatase
MAASGAFSWNSELPSGHNPFWIRDEGLAGLDVHAGDAVSVDTRAEPTDGDLVVAEVELDGDSLRLAGRFFSSPGLVRLERVGGATDTLEVPADSVMVMGVIVGRLSISADGGLVREEPITRRRHAVVFSSGVMDIGSATDVGRVRPGNEDALLVLEPDGARKGQVLVAVADGMGGHKAGEVASALAVESLQRTVNEADADLTPAELLTAALQLGNRTIWEAAAEDVEKDGMGTTLVCALVDPDGNVVIANVGDSRAYAFVKGQAVLVTEDHTWVNQQVQGGYMSKRDASSSPFRNLLTRTLGNAPRVNVDLFSGLQLEAGDGLILVSDGVTGYLDESDFASVMQSAASAQSAAERLVREAVKRGGADNATAVVVRRN